jgi:hypothetical protein
LICKFEVALQEEEGKLKGEAELHIFAGPILHLKKKNDPTSLEVNRGRDPHQ